MTQRIHGENSLTVFLICDHKNTLSLRRRLDEDAAATGFDAHTSEDFVSQVGFASIDTVICDTSLSIIYDDACRARLAGTFQRPRVCCYPISRING